MTASSYKSATSGLGAQNQIIKHLLAWRTNPIGLNIIQNLDLPCALESITLIKNKPVSTDEKIDCAFQISFNPTKSTPKTAPNGTDNKLLDSKEGVPTKFNILANSNTFSNGQPEPRTIDVLISNKNILYPEHLFNFTSFPSSKNSCSELTSPKQPKQSQLDKHKCLQKSLPPEFISFNSQKSNIEPELRQYWEEFWRQHFSIFQLSTHPTHHVGRINFKKALDYALFDSLHLDINSALLSHFVDGQSLAFQDDIIKNKVLAHLNKNKKNLLSNNLLGLSTTAQPTHLGITFSAHHCTLHSLSVLPNELLLQAQTLYLLLQEIFFKIKNQSSFSFTDELEHNLYLKSAYTVFFEVFSKKKSSSLFVEKILSQIKKTNLNKKDGPFFSTNLNAASFDSKVLLFLWSSFFGSALLCSALHKAEIAGSTSTSTQSPSTDKASPPNTQIVAFHSMKMPQTLNTLQTLEVNISTPQSTQIGVIGNALWHLQCGKSLSSGTQTDAQMKINLLLLLFLNLFNITAQ